RLDHRGEVASRSAAGEDVAAVARGAQSCREVAVRRERHEDRPLADGRPLPLDPRARVHEVPVDMAELLVAQMELVRHDELRAAEQPVAASANEPGHRPLDGAEHDDGRPAQRDRGERADKDDKRVEQVRAVGVKDAGVDPVWKDLRLRRGPEALANGGDEDVVETHPGTRDATSVRHRSCGRRYAFPRGFAPWPAKRTSSSTTPA